MLLSTRSRPGRILLPVLFCLACVVEGGAQPARTQGWVAGVHSGAAFVSFGSDPADGAALVGARIGHGLNPVVAPYVGVAYATIDSRGLEAFDQVTFAYVDLGVRLHLAQGPRRWVPYGDLALTFWPVTDVMEKDERAADFTSTPILGVGGGLLLYLSEARALDVSVKWGRGTFEDVPVGDGPAHGTRGRPAALLDLDASSVRLAVGISWWW